MYMNMRDAPTLHLDTK